MEYLGESVSFSPKFESRQVAPRKLGEAAREHLGRKSEGSHLEFRLSHLAAGPWVAEALCPLRAWEGRWVVLLPGKQKRRDLASTADALFPFPMLPPGRARASILVSSVTFPPCAENSRKGDMERDKEGGAERDEMPEVKC